MRDHPDSTAGNRDEINRRQEVSPDPVAVVNASVVASGLLLGSRVFCRARSESEIRGIGRSERKFKSADDVPRGTKLEAVEVESLCSLIREFAARDRKSSWWSREIKLDLQLRRLLATRPCCPIGTRIQNFRSHHDDKASMPRQNEFPTNRSDPNSDYAVPA